MKVGDSSYRRKKLIVNLYYGISRKADQNIRFNVMSLLWFDAAATF